MACLSIGQVFAAAVEASSEHPLAKAIAAAVDGEPEHRDEVKDFTMVPGKGVKGVVDGRKVVCGTEAWLRENGVVAVADAINCVPPAADRLRGEGKAVVFVAAESILVGLVALADTPRTEAKDALAELAAAGVSSCLLTGDHATTAATVARELGVAEVKAELLPEQKAAAVEDIQRDGRFACMVGDGVNDAVALKTAHVGIAMGGAGTDIAVEAADIALAKGPCLIHDRLSKEEILKKGYSCTSVFTFASDLKDKIVRARISPLYCDVESDEEVIRGIHEEDSIRINWHRAHSDTEWGQADAYDLCINTDAFGRDYSAELIAKAMKG